jgi:hypothetical protein
MELIPQASLARRVTRTPFLACKPATEAAGKTSGLGGFALAEAVGDLLAAQLALAAFLPRRAFAVSFFHDVSFSLGAPNITADGARSRTEWALDIDTLKIYLLIRYIERYIYKKGNVYVW